MGRGDLVRGEPYSAGGRILTPIARLRAYRSPDGSFELLRVSPVGIVEESGGERRMVAFGGDWTRPPIMLALLALPVIVYVVALAMTRAERRPGPIRKSR